MGAFGCLICLRLSSRLSGAGSERAQELAPKVGLDAVAAVAALGRPLRVARLGWWTIGAGLALTVAGLLGYTGVLPLSRNFSSIQPQEALRIGHEHRYTHHYEYVQMQGEVNWAKEICQANLRRAARSAAEFCYAPVRSLEDDLYVKVRVGDPLPSEDLTGVLMTKGEVFLNSALKRDDFDDAMLVLDLDWGREAAKNVATRNGLLLGAGSPLLALAAFRRLVP